MAKAYHTDINCLFTISTQSLMCHAIFGHIGTSQLVDTWFGYRSAVVKCLSQRHYDALNS